MPDQRAKNTMATKATVLQHAVAENHLARIRDEQTGPDEFRRRMKALAGLLASEATQDLSQKPVKVTTPLETMECRVLADRIAIVPILRAGLVLVEPLLELIPEAEVWHLGMYRDESTASPVHYYNKLPVSHPPGTGLVVDPMLATGGSAVDAIGALQKWGIKDIRLLAVIAAPEGIERLQQECPEVRIYCCVCDRELNDQKFILPGLGDAGDRIFGT